MEYRRISAAYPGWGLREIKQLPTRERIYWLKHAMWETEVRRQHAG
jgi:hypothetical protein